MSGPIAVQNEIQTTRVSPSPSVAPVTKKPDFSYERSVQAILKDRDVALAEKVATNGKRLPI